MNLNFFNSKNDKKIYLKQANEIPNGLFSSKYDKKFRIFSDNWFSNSGRSY